MMLFRLHNFIHDCTATGQEAATEGDVFVLIHCWKDWLKSLPAKNRSMTQSWLNLNSGIYINVLTLDGDWSVEILYDNG